jgi:hypothetical protein
MGRVEKATAGHMVRLLLRLGVQWGPTFFLALNRRMPTSALVSTTAFTGASPVTHGCRRICLVVRRTDGSAT